MLAPTTQRRNAYNMVVNKYGDRLYRGLVETETRHLSEVRKRCRRRLTSWILLGGSPVVHPERGAWLPASRKQCFQLLSP